MTVVAACLLAAAAWWAWPTPGEQRLGAVAGVRALDRGHLDPNVAAAAPGRRLTWLAAAPAALAIALLVGGVVGLVLGAGVALVLPLLLGRLEPRGARARRELLEQQAPLLADLLSATLASGAPLRAALGAVVPAVGDPTSEVLRPVLAAIDLGADPIEAWRTATTPAHADIVEAIVRASRSGAPLSRVLARIADDLRRERRSVVQVAARSAGVRAVAPLAACFLPAFLLLGVVPVVASLATALL